MTPTAALLQLRICGGMIKGRRSCLAQASTIPPVGNGEDLFSLGWTPGLLLEGRSKQMSVLKKTRGAASQRSGGSTGSTLNSGWSHS